MILPYDCVRTFRTLSILSFLIACNDATQSKDPHSGSSEGGASSADGTAGDGTRTSHTSSESGGAAGSDTNVGGSSAVDGGSTTGGTSAGSSAPSNGGTTSTTSTTRPPVPTKFVGNITTNGVADGGTLKFATYWDQITPENAGKWGSVQPTASSSFNWATLDAIYDYAQKNGILFKEHVFVWGSQQPSGTLTETHVKNWMTAFCARYPNTKLIDVVNEPPPHSTPSYVEAMGGGTNTTWQWIINAFVWAREACPNAILILNDYNNIEYGNDTLNSINIANALKAAGAPIDAIGAQAHGLDGAVSFDTVKSLLTELHAQTNLPIYITELDLSTSDDAEQLALYQQYLPYFMETESIKGITLWGWIYGTTWYQSPYSGLVKNGVSRPAMKYLMNYLGRPAP